MANDSVKPTDSPAIVAQKKMIADMKRAAPLETGVNVGGRLPPDNTPETPLKKQ